MENPIPADCHVHTPLCGHAIGSPVEYVHQAAAQGLKVIAFTCHTPMTNPKFGGPSIRMDFQQVPEYLAMLDRAKSTGDSLGVEVLRGIEAEWFPEEAELAEMDSMIAVAHFDYVLGSVHPHLEIYREWFARQGIEEDSDKIQCYWNHAILAAESGRYDAFAHADIVRSYKAVNHYTTEGHEPLIAQFLQTISTTGICLEINTSGLHKPSPEIHPEPWIVRQAGELKLPIVVGSDAHQPGRVASGFSNTASLLSECGWQSVHVFRNRKRCALSFPPESSSGDPEWRAATAINNQQASSPHSK